MNSQAVPRQYISDSGAIHESPLHATGTKPEHIQKYKSMEPALHEALRIFTVIDANTGEEILTTQLHPRADVRQQFGISDRHLCNYINLLLEAVPEEFLYDKGSECFDHDQYKALVKVWTFFKLGLKRKQIVNKLRTEGV
ncbi:hypothetical protein H6F93_00545 [Leptolyngbya sp. FACHB-671]|uniref:hypothetical protein n=1 Tax=Leptolyngbya sp. FACHB-671 TaxID=2692812 RepID=UPI0016854D31|nr:hypothetical protein [Leptolyngbya sp. FACHB-671]MBD2066039.1 hypothetical protein [Leptolyngbya sp. FACHB-671]